MVRSVVSIVVCAVSLGFAGTARSAVKLPALISEGMVLQQKVPVRIWGSADEGEKVSVSFRGQTAETVAKDGRWSVVLRPLEPGGPFTLTITGTNTIELKDVLVGDVWVCSGQSNMEFHLSDSFDAKKDINAVADPNLRMFTAARHVAEYPENDVAGGKWESASSATRGGFSAVGFYFGRALREDRKVPIGLIHTSWGGTPAEAWTGRSALHEWGMPFTAFKGSTVDAKTKEDYLRRLTAWRAAGEPQGRFDDPGIAETAKSWALAQTDTRDWHTMNLPQKWESAGPEMEIDGGVWFRKEVDIPAAWAGKELELRLGAIDDFDTTYFNGVKVGATGIETPNFWQAPRRYVVPGTLAKAGKAVIAVRAWDHGGEGGLTGPAEKMSLAPRVDSSSTSSQQDKAISLAGPWKYQIEVKRLARPVEPGADPNAPSVLYNGMIAPLLPYAIKGATWYQGESNSGRAAQYRSLLSTMIRNWRDGWGIGDFPFLIVQLAPYMARSAEPEESGWAALREAQWQVTQVVPNAGLAVITDVGEENDIHPKKKQPVGERLAIAARKLAYGEAITSSGPSLKGVKLGDGKAIVSFDNVGKGLEARGDALTGFALAGADKKFYFADATIAGTTVVVSSPKVPAPAYVRFGWANFPVVNLFNKDGLPAVPFRTDPADR
jgi:sialate O-acetylesterase